MQPRKSVESRAWIAQPFTTEAGSLMLAGSVRDAPGIAPARMRNLGRFALAYVVRGQGYYEDARGVRRDLAAGDLVLVFPDLPHAYGPKERGSWDQIYLVFDGPQFELWRRAGLLTPERPVVRLEPVDYWRRRLEALLPPAGARGRAAAVGVLGRLLHLLADIVAADLHGAAVDRGGDWLEKSMHLLGEREPGGWLRPQQVARQVGLSYENFRKRFAALARESPGQYQKRCRIDRACAAIYQGQQSFKEIAEALDFCDVFHFSKAFRQVTGLSPSAFRQRVRGR